MPDAADRLDPAERADFQAERVFAIPIHVRDTSSDEPTPVITAVPYNGVEHADELRPRVRDFFACADRLIATRGKVSFSERPLVALPHEDTTV